MYYNYIIGLLKSFLYSNSYVCLYFIVQSVDEEPL